MVRSNARVSIFLVSLRCLLLAAKVCSSTILRYREDAAANGNASQTVVLAGLFPMSVNENEKCGMLRKSAVERVEAMVYAIRRINENSNLLPRVNLIFDIHDTCTIPIMALEDSLNFVRLEANSSIPVSGVIGPAITDGSVLVASVLQLFQIPQISYGSTAAVLSDQSRFEYFFRTIPSDVQQVRAIASIINHYNWSYVFVLHSGDTYGTDGAQALLQELNAANETTCIAAQISLPLGGLENDTVFDEAVEVISQDWVRNASVAVLFSHREEANGMLSAVERRVSLDPESPLVNLTWIGSDSWGLSLESRFYSRARGMLTVQPISNPIEDFVEYFTNLTPNSTNNPWFSGYWESFFSCSLSNRGNPCSLETQRLPRNLTLTSQQNPYVISGVYAFAVSLHKMLVDLCPNGNLCEDVTVARLNSLGVDGTKLRRYLLNVSLSDTDLFPKINGTLFDSFGDVRDPYTVYNLKHSANNRLSFELVGTWEFSSGLSIDDEKIEWRSGSVVPQSVCSVPCEPGQELVSIPNQERCCWTCRNCLGEFTVSSGDRCYECENKFLPSDSRSSCISIPLTYFSWSNPLGLFTAVLASLGASVCTCTGLGYVIFFNNKIIKASSRELSAILLCGVFFCYILPFIFLIKPSPAACSIQRIGSGLSFSIVFSALLVKTNRIHRIFNRADHKITTPIRFIGPVSQVSITCLLVLVQIVIVSIWLAVEPPKVEEVELNRKTLELMCSHNPSATLLVNVLYNIFLLLGSAYFGFRTRKVPENYEAKFINVTMLTLCLVWIAFVPTFYISIVELGTVYNSFFLLLTIILSASTIMGCLLMPRVLIVIFQKVQEIHQSSQERNLPNTTMNWKVTQDTNLDTKK